MKGRGVSTQPDHRFQKVLFDNSEEFQQPTYDDDVSSPRTQFLLDPSKSIISQNDSPDVGFTHSINPYRGCEHGCVYCFARPTHEYLELSAGLDFETKILVKEEAPILLRDALNKKSWQGDAITLSGITDCYQPVERRLQLTRKCLEVLAEFHNPFSIITKNHLVTRDIDIIAPMAKRGAAAVFISLTTLDADLARTMEPRTSQPSARLRAIEQLTQAGIPVGVMIAPLIPGLTDQELPALLKAAASAGASYAGYVPLRLPYVLDELFENWLEQSYPMKKERVLNRIKEIRGGKLNDSRFGNRMRGEGKYAEHLRSMFHLFVSKEGLNRERFQLTSEHFSRPSPQLAMEL